MLGGTARLADQIFLLAHDEHTGRSHLADRVAGLAVAGALLGELVLVGRIDVKDGNLVALEATMSDDTLVLGALPNQHAHGVDPVLARMLREIEGEEHRPVRDWLAYFAQRSADDVAHRMSVENMVWRRTTRFPLPRSSWIPTNPNTTALVATHLCHVMIRREATSQSAILAGLTRITGLERHLPLLFELRDRSDAREYVSTLLIELTDHPLGDVLRHTEAAIAAAFASHRA